jgi:hypothetical protein
MDEKLERLKERAKETRKHPVFKYLFTPQMRANDFRGEIPNLRSQIFQLHQ